MSEKNREWRRVCRRWCNKERPALGGDRRVATGEQRRCSTQMIRRHEEEEEEEKKQNDEE